ncbi:shikimate dehydrogenase [Lederbergia graminis]|uniref:Shikimate dehydrogenase (NADP(+)) n=1 Tax=Lederbergia graminis TaxID=735518 RepID=A0ABW0LLC2_9BACI
MQKLYGVIGDPIGHSMSPIMHNNEFKQLNINAHYHPFHIVEQNLEIAIAGMKAIGVEGFNVTIPHKTTIIPYLDYIDPLAKAIGAVNTVVRVDGEYHGYNTDGEGYMKALQAEWKDNLENEKVLILGAGGAAKAIYFTLLAKGVLNVDIANRSIDKAENLIKHCPYVIENSKALTLSDAEQNLQEYSLIIQTTSIGMYPNINDCIISLEKLNKNAMVSDIVYNPFETLLLKTAKQKGCNIQNGIGMFVYQGALAFEMWTNKFPDINRMTDIVIRQLGGK